MAAAGLASALFVAPAAATTTPPRPGQIVPEADLAALPEPARREVDNLRHRLAAGLADPARSQAELAGGFLLLGQLYHAYGLAEAAERAFSAGLAVSPEDPELLHRRGLARRDLASFAAAAEDFAAVVAARPQRVGAWLHLGHARVDLGLAAEARQAFLRARELGARAAAEHGLGRAALAAGDAAAAVEHLQAALSLQPSASVAHAELARAHAALGDEERAARHRARAGDGPFDDHDPVDDERRRIRAMLAFDALREMASRGEGFDEAELVRFTVDELGDVPGAVDRLRQAVAAADAAPAPAAPARLRVAVAALLLVEERLDEAIVELREALAAAPELGHARLELAGALARRGRDADALAQYDRFLADEPSHPVALTRRASILVRLGRTGEASRDLVAAVAAAADPESVADARTLLALLAVDAGRLDAAAEHLRRALAADPDHAHALRAQAHLLGRLGRYRPAAEVFGRLVALAPADADARDAEAVALLLAGDEAAARARLEEAVAELPDGAVLQRRLARLLAAAADRSLRDGERAVELALAAFAAAPTAEAVETLAMAYAEAGDHEQAVVWQRRLIAASQEAGERDRHERNLALYEAGRSCCADEPPSPTGGSR